VANIIIPDTREVQVGGGSWSKVKKETQFEKQLKQKGLRA
jgi:hypothetical protein